MNTNRKFLLLCLILVIVGFLLLSPSNDSGTSQVIGNKLRDICGVYLVQGSPNQQPDIHTETPSSISNQLSEGVSDASPPTINVLQPRFYRNIVANGDLGFTEGYMYGDWDTPDLKKVLTHIMQNQTRLKQLQNYSFRDNPHRPPGHVI